jgi:glycosyltransferase involved in cell wall biosynthesis
MNRVALLCSEPIRSCMGGIGIRYLELARRLPRHGLDVVLVTCGDPAAVPPDVAAAVPVRVFRRGQLREILFDCAAAVTQGYLANDLVRECAELPVAIDMYDPFMIENLHYTESLGIDQYRNDHATSVLQLSRGDFFLCSSEEQRLFYLGFLAALGRVNPRRLDGDPNLDRLIATVPYGVPEEIPPHRPVLGERRPNERRLLFGGLYDWYDPWTVLEALAERERAEWTLYFVRNPNPADTPQRLLGAVEEWCRQRGWLGRRVQIIDWVPADRRFDLLRDVDALVVTHVPNLEARLSLRTRILEALACGCPVVASEGGTMSDLLWRHGAGWTVAPGNVRALAEVLDRVVGEGGAALGASDGAREILQSHAWPRVLEPLVRFCRAPKVDATKNEFAFHPTASAPRDSIAVRIRRRWQRRTRARAAAAHGTGSEN